MASERRGLTPGESERIRSIAEARDSGTYYDLLGVPPGAPAEAVERAFHSLAREWHPDRFYSRDTGELGRTLEDNFAAITKAFQTLRDETRRASYNRENEIDVRPAVSPPPRTPAAQPRRPGAQPAGPAPAEPAATPQPKHAATPAIEKIRQQLGERLTKAAQYYEAGRTDFNNRKFAKAESSLYVAVQYDPKNTTYQALLATASAKARELRAQQYIVRAEQEESYRRFKEAISLYTKAVECEPPDGVAYFRLGNLVRTHDQDDRAALGWLRKSILKEPNNATYRLALVDLYEKLGMVSNAVREAVAALEADPKSEPARAAVRRLKK